jgi:hypothetical protein
MEITAVSDDFGANEFGSVMTLVQDYFDGLHYGDVPKLGAIFHPDAFLKAPGLRCSLEQWLDAVASRPAPERQGLPYDFKLLSIEIIKGLDISETGVLLDIAEQQDMDRVATQNALSSSQVAQALENKIERQKEFKLRSIPAFILNEDTLISGSNSVEFFENTMSNIVDELSLNKKLAI